MSDLISRADIPYHKQLEPMGNGQYFEVEVAYKDDIDALPSAEPKTGEWTNVGVLTVRCSNCKSEFHELEAMNFCPSCGSRMLGEDGEA